MMLLRKLIVTALSPLGGVVGGVRFKYDRLRLKSLMNRGLKIGRNVYIEAGVSFDPVYPYLIEIGDNCRIAMGTKILAHDATIFRELGVNRISPVRILEGCFIGERAFILPGVTIGPHAMIAAGSLVNRDIPEGKVAAGNPARPYADFKDMLDKYRTIAARARIFSKKDIEAGRITPSDIAEQLKSDPVAFVQGVPKSEPCYINTDFEEIKRSALERFEELTKGAKSGLP